MTSRKTLSRKFVVTVLVVVPLLASCGNKGPLVLPSEIELLSTNHSLNNYSN